MRGIFDFNQSSTMRFGLLGGKLNHALVEVDIFPI